MSAPDRTNPNGEPHEADLLAPWRAIDRLGADDAAALERMLAEDPQLARRLEYAAEERDETVALNEALPTPSRGAMDRLFERIEAEEAARAPKGAGVMRWLSAKLSLASPGQLAWGATAAALLIAVQAGLLAGSYLGGAGEEGTYETASDKPLAPAPAQGFASPTALVAFQPGATAEQISAALTDTGFEIVGGPKPGGVYVVRPPAKLTRGAADALKPLRDRTDVVRFVTQGATP